MFGSKAFYIMSWDLLGMGKHQREIQTEISCKLIASILLKLRVLFNDIRVLGTRMGLHALRAFVDWKILQMDRRRRDDTAFPADSLYIYTSWMLGATRCSRAGEG